MEGGFVVFDDIDDISGDFLSGGVSFEHPTCEKFGFGGAYASCPSTSRSATTAPEGWWLRFVKFLVPTG